MSGKLFVVGLGPGDRSLLTPQAFAALHQADVVVGYTGYFVGLEDLLAGKECLALPLAHEVDRARLAVRHAHDGRTVCVISSGDPGVYAMASLILEVAAADDVGRPLDVVVIPGVSAIQACASLLGAPLGHDFAVVSLSDLLTPWGRIERRLQSAVEADFVLALLNPKSERRTWELPRAREILLRCCSPQVPVGVVRNAYRAGQSVTLTTLGDMLHFPVDMFTTIIIGNSQTRRLGDRLVTPRGYALTGEEPPATDSQSGAKSTGVAASFHPRPRPGDILAESFAIIEREVGLHSFGPQEWPVVRRMIHACGDLELVKAVCFHKDPVRAGLDALRRGVPFVTDVSMVATGINKPALSRFGLTVHCFIDAPEIREEAERIGQTRSYCAMARACRAFPEAVFVVGNAPTALLALCDAVRQGIARPPLVIALPVGFVAVVESKEEALSLDVPVITMPGRKGGSAMGAAVANALMEMLEI
jgi:precorrin-3B C17-methyltransferase